MKRQTEQQFLSKRELADMLGLSIYTIDAWVIRREQIPFIRMGRRVMFALADIEAWLAKNKSKPAAE